jgi:hypothetical protein
MAQKSADSAVESHRSVLCRFSRRDLVQSGAQRDGSSLPREAGTGLFDHERQLRRLGGNLPGYSLVSGEVVGGKAIE